MQMCIRNKFLGKGKAVLGEQTTFQEHFWHFSRRFVVRRDPKRFLRPSNSQQIAKKLSFTTKISPKTSELNHIKCFEPFMQLQFIGSNEKKRTFISFQWPNGDFHRRFLSVSVKNGSFACLGQCFMFVQFHWQSLRLFAK